MIVQTAPVGSPHFVIKQVDHARFSGQFARAFGNATFAPLHPRELMEHVVAHHDEGWTVVDDAPMHDSHTGLPYHLTQIPMGELLKTGAGSPNFNQHKHAFCGVISSMHTYGLYHGRYGLSDRIVIDLVPPEYKAKTQGMLQGELDRQESLKDQLCANPETVEWASSTVLFHSADERQRRSDAPHCAQTWSGLQRIDAECERCATGAGRRRELDPVCGVCERDLQPQEHEHEWAQSLEMLLQVIELTQANPHPHPLPLGEGVRIGIEPAISVAFGCPFEGDVPASRVIELAKAYARMGLREICIADTVGLANPRTICSMMTNLQEALPECHFSLHLHDTRGLGLANVMAALEVGISTFESSIGGLGGCPTTKVATGNISTEDW